MTPAETSVQLKTPEPLPYQWAMIRYLQTEEPDVWKWFASTRKRDEHAEALRLDLLKSTYRLEPTTQPRLYSLAEEVSSRYGLTIPITFYQSQTGNGINAALAYLTGEAHIVFTGPVLTVLSETELKGVLGHELAHFLLYEKWEGGFRVATEVLHALSNDAAAAPPHLESARLFDLYGEVFADRGSYCITGDVGVAISTLVKIETGLNEVSADSYLRQAEEIFTKSRVQANQLTHPELYIRARALKLWADQGEEARATVEHMIEGPPALDRLDLLGQQRVAATTRRLVDHLLAPRWFHSEPVLAHARLFFNNFIPPLNSLDGQSLADEVKNSDPALQDYFCYVLLDFVTVDRELGDPALASALVLSRQLGLDSRFAEIALKELDLGKRHFNKIDRAAGEILAKMNEGPGKS